MISELQYIRQDNVVFEIDQETKKPIKIGHMRFDSISKAKHFCRNHPMGAVRRYESLEREHGRQFMKELFK